MVVAVVVAVTEEAIGGGPEGVPEGIMSGPIVNRLTVFCLHVLRMVYVQPVTIANARNASLGRILRMESFCLLPLTELQTVAGAEMRPNA